MASLTTSSSCLSGYSIQQVSERSWVRPPLGGSKFFFRYSNLQLFFILFTLTKSHAIYTATKDMDHIDHFPFLFRWRVLLCISFSSFGRFLFNLFSDSFSRFGYFQLSRLSVLDCFVNDGLPLLDFSYIRILVFKQNDVTVFTQSSCGSSSKTETILFQFSR